MWKKINKITCHNIQAIIYILKFIPYPNELRKKYRDDFAETIDHMLIPYKFEFFENIYLNVYLQERERERERKRNY